MTILLSEYNKQVAPADRLPVHDLNPVLFGLFGEVGSIVTTFKKHYRESDAYTGYQVAIEEEFGDVLWYFAALCRRVGLTVDVVFGDIWNSDASHLGTAASDVQSGPIAQVALSDDKLDRERILLELGEAVAGLLSITTSSTNAREKLGGFARSYLRAVRCAGVPFAQLTQSNIRKVRGRFVAPELATLPKFDERSPVDEQLPAEFEISITQRRNGQSYLKWNGVFIGDPLTDNIADKDGYRYHDVFHLAHAAILHWSPVFRALIKHKRKSDPNVDEEEDGGRAIVVEEGLTAWIFTQAKEQNFFADRNSLSFDLLKTVRQFVSGYQVQTCPLSLWEKAIVEGYKVFRQVRDKDGGIVVGNRSTRTISYKSL